MSYNKLRWVCLSYCCYKVARLFLTFSHDVNQVAWPADSTHCASIFWKRGSSLFQSSELVFHFEIMKQAQRWISIDTTRSWSWVDRFQDIFLVVEYYWWCDEDWNAKCLVLFTISKPKAFYLTLISKASSWSQLSFPRLCLNPNQWHLLDFLLSNTRLTI